MGFINAIGDYIDKAYDASYNMAVSAKNGLNRVVANMSTMFDSEIDTQPTIRPVVDMTNVESSARRINAVFSRQQAVAVGVGMNNRLSSNYSNGEQAYRESQRMSTVTFTQNNYSPKALSRDEIYRQTNNQLSTIKKELGIL